MTKYDCVTSVKFQGIPTLEADSPGEAAEEMKKRLIKSCSDLFGEMGIVDKMQVTVVKHNEDELEFEKQDFASRKAEGFTHSVKSCSKEDYIEA